MKNLSCSNNALSGVFIIAFTLPLIPDKYHKFVYIIAKKLFDLLFTYICSSMFSKLIYTIFFEFHAEFSAHIGKASVDGIKQCFTIEVIYRIKSFFFELSPKRFGNIRMRRIRRQICNKESSLLPVENPLFDDSRFMYAGIV